jgi:hypothetical protein
MADEYPADNFEGTDEMPQGEARAIRGRTVARDEQRDLAASEDRPETVADGNRVYIEKVQNGFIVKVGCSRFVSQSWTEVACALELYYNDPAAAERKYCR